jgi:hypothetical protein
MREGEREGEGLIADKPWAVFRDKITSIVNEHIPIRLRRTPNKSVWMTREAIRAIRRKRRLWTKAE